MTEPQAQPPVAPARRPSLLERIVARLPKPHHAPEAAQPLLSCSHRWPDGTSAWVACTWSGSAWVSHCQRCGLYAYCR